MRHFMSFFTIVLFAILGASSASSQTTQSGVIIFTSNGTGPQFSDLLDTGNPDAVDFNSVTSGQVNGVDAVLSITGSGTTAPQYWNDGFSFYTEANLGESSLTLQYNTHAAHKVIESLQGPLHYEFITSQFFLEKLTLSGILTDAHGDPQHFFFSKNVDPSVGDNIVVADFAPVPELASSAHFAVMLCFALGATLWKARLRRME